MNQYKIEGVIHKIFNEERKTERFVSREFILLIQDNYAQHVKFQLTQNNCSILDGFAEGETVDVEFSLNGREWNDKYFNNLYARNIKLAGELADEVPPLQQPISRAEEGLLYDDSDHIPF